MTVQISERKYYIVYRLRDESVGGARVVHTRSSFNLLVEPHDLQVGRFTTLLVCSAAKDNMRNTFQESGTPQ